jgi:hypothetical protein
MTLLGVQIDDTCMWRHSFDIQKEYDGQAGLDPGSLFWKPQEQQIANQRTHKGKVFNTLKGRGRQNGGRARSLEC